MRLFIFLVLFASGLQASAQHTIIETALAALNSKFVVSSYNKPQSPNGVIVFEEHHDKQFYNATLAVDIHHLDTAFNKIALEGLYFDFKCRKIVVENDTLRNIYKNLVARYLFPMRMDMAISNAEYLFLTENISLLKTEDSVDYAVKGPSFTVEPQLVRMAYLDQFMSTEYEIEQLSAMRFEGSDSILYSSGVRDLLQFLRVVSRRSDTIAGYIANYYRQFGKLFAIIGASHTSRITSLLRSAGVPYVVISERSILNYGRPSALGRKPAPVIDKKPVFFENVEHELLKYLYKYQLMSNRGNLLASVRQVLSQFRSFTNVRLDAQRNLTFIHRGQNGSWTPQAVAGLPDYTTLSLVRAEASLRQIKVIPPVQLSVEEASATIDGLLRSYFSSADYARSKNHFKYEYKGGRPSDETDWTDKIIPGEIRFDPLEIQNSISKGKRPDWYLQCSDGRWLSEVKYIRNRRSFEYAFELLYSDQLEKYLLDELLNPSQIDVIILYDKEGLLKKGVPMEKILLLQEMLRIVSERLRQQHGKPINIRFYEVRVNMRRGVGSAAFTLC